ncbi:MAG: TIGR04141 family sporadically distributed protein [bacterium]|nr:TIGR04141 family sporadically distributed protein [bacterium]
MATFNIYKMDKVKESSLLEKLQAVGLSRSDQKTVDGFTLSLYLSEEPEPIDIWWTELYADYLGTVIKPKNKAYFAVFLISNASLLYAISMGKSHFYLKDFCDGDFGINLAERIADNDHLKLKNSKLFGGKKSNTIISYQENSKLEYDSGESIHYVKAKTTDIKKWGEVASFGNSAQLHLEITPDDLPDLVKSIEVELKREPKIVLPRATAISDVVIITELDRKLAQEILSNTNAGLQPAEATVSGVDFVFLDKNQFCFIFNRQRQDISGELNLAALRVFINQQSIDLLTSLNEIKVKVSDEHSKGYTKPLKYFLDYVDDERHFLLDGKWHIFNQNYIAFLQKQIDDRITFAKPNINFSNSAFTKWKNGLSDDDRVLHGYAEYYFNTLRENEGYINLDRQIETLQQYKIEKLDLYKDDTAYFVKIGTPQKLGYVIDQAVSTINILQSQTSTIQIDGQDIKPKNICLWLILDRQTEIAKISEINSLIFMMKLAEWQRQCSNAGYNSIVRIGYRQP